ncbi:hypothetical protein GCM10007103_23490 [Salinimicrobium marinum]|jgi:hypothetical protein|uniref:DUF2911 domain-containing protein n=1 Tax=Salinimicrobium marinum TaxID=680283 RepID=A0A918SH45_9FLAO|nr:DUF2911 domain-containing protein [Salinimicrobium marinum]GHA41361.1 hypothetical protein GCM10007103_23490 [Salinimicrobium marinum]
MKNIMLMAAIILGCLGTSEIKAQDNDGKTGNPNFSKMDVSPMDVALFRNQEEEAVARVLYSRPQRRDREVFGKLVPFGEVWRTGANEATELTLYKDMMVGNETIKAGTYTLYTIPEENEWTVILNKSTNVWGAYDYHVEQDMARIKVPVRRAQTSIESLSMAFEPSEEGAKLLIGWDDRYVEVPFKDPGM